MAKKLSPFEEAFAEARAKGEKTFPFNGKLYGTRMADEGQKKVDAMPSMSRQSGSPRAGFVEGVKASDQADWDSSPAASSGLSDTAKGFRAAREKYGDTPSIDAIMDTGKAAIAAIPAGRALGAVRPAIGAAVKYMSKKDNPISKEEDPAWSSGRSRDSLFGDETPGGFKKGGKVSGASKRGDGIAQRGKTKGRFV